MQFDELESRNESSAQVSDVSFVAWQHSTGYYRGIDTPGKLNLSQSRRNLTDLDTTNQTSPVRRALMDVSTRITEETNRSAFAQDENLLEEHGINNDDIIELDESDDDTNANAANREIPNVIPAMVKIPSNCSPQTEVHSTSHPINQPSTSQAGAANAHQSAYQNGIADERPRFKCKLCNHTTPRKYDLARHLLVHQKKPFQCPVCPKRYAAKDLLDIHVACHKGQETNAKAKLHKCNICTYSTDRPFELKNHMRKHAGGKQFACDYCDMTFKQRYGATRHMRTVHKNHKMK